MNVNRLNGTANNMEDILPEMITSQGKIRGARYYGGMSIEFFQPDSAFIDWIVAYAAGRLIVDIGCGSALTTMRLQDAGGRACGIDPFYDMEAGSRMNMDRIMHDKEMVQVLPLKIEDCLALITDKGTKILMLFCRPCHSNFVINVLNLKDKETEALYITIPENLRLYNDLGSHEDRMVKIDHKGWSVEKEEVYSII